jgi:hypothetical protein
MCIAIENEIIDEDLVKDSAKYLIINAWKFFGAAIIKFREDTGSKDAWNRISEKHENWKDKNYSS